MTHRESYAVGIGGARPGEAGRGAGKDTNTGMPGIRIQEVGEGR